MSVEELRFALQGDGGFHQKAARAFIGGVRHEDKSSGCDGVDPASRSDTTVVFRTLEIEEVGVSEGGRSVQKQIFRAGQNSTALRSLEFEAHSLSGKQVPFPVLRVDGSSVEDGPCSVIRLDTPDDFPVRCPVSSHPSSAFGPESIVRRLITHQQHVVFGAQGEHCTVDVSR